MKVLLGWCGIWIGFRLDGLEDMRVLVYNFYMGCEISWDFWENGLYFNRFFCRVGLNGLDVFVVLEIQVFNIAYKLAYYL